MAFLVTQIPEPTESSTLSSDNFSLSLVNIDAVAVARDHSQKTEEIVETSALKVDLKEGVAQKTERFIEEIISSPPCSNSAIDNNFIPTAEDSVSIIRPKLYYNFYN